MTAGRTMTSSRPYLIRALYEWIVDNGMTPHILVDALAQGVEVPQRHVQEGRVVLNINPSAVEALHLGNELIEFSARFGGVASVVRIPTPAIMAIFARENEQGMVFGSESPPAPQEPPPQAPGETPSGAKKSTDKKPVLKVIK